MAIKCVSFSLTAATVRLERTSISIVEGNEGESNLIEVCVVLEDILDGLERELVFTLSVTLGTAGKKQPACMDRL